MANLLSLQNMFLDYMPLILVIAFAIYYIIDKDKESEIKNRGIKVPGIIIANKDGGQRRSMRRLGGNINSPTIKFITKNGEEIIGKPIIGFISQQEVKVPRQVFVIYDSKNPKRFYLAEDQPN